MSALAGPFCEERVPVEYPLLLPQSAGSSRHRVVSINNLRSHQTATRPLTNCGENHLHREISESFWGTSDYSGISTENSTNQYDWGRKSACMKWWMIKLLGVSLQCIGPPAKMTRSWKNAQTRVCYSSGLLCYFLTVDNKYWFFLHFAVKIDIKGGWIVTL